MALPRANDHLHEPTDAQLAGDAARGNPDALASLYARYARGLFAVAYRLLQSTEDAEDVVHDVFVGLPEALRRYDERGSLGPWLKKITARVALARMREATRHHVPLDQATTAAMPGRDIESVLTLEQ